MSWADTVLKKIGAPISGVQVDILDLWAQSEGTPPSINNWLACGTPWPGSRPYNASGVQVYPTFNAGSSAIAWSLQHAPYVPISDALRAARGMVSVWKAINASPWCPGCQSGHYPVALWEAAGQPSQGTPLAPSTPPEPVAVTPTAGGAAAGVPVDAWGRVQDDAGHHAAYLRGRIITLGTRIRRA